MLVKLFSESCSTNTGHSPMRHSMENTRSMFDVAPRKHCSKIELFRVVRLDAIPSDTRSRVGEGGNQQNLHRLTGII